MAKIAKPAAWAIGCGSLFLVGCFIFFLFLAAVARGVVNSARSGVNRTGEAKSRSVESPLARETKPPASPSPAPPATPAPTPSPESIQSAVASIERDAASAYKASITVHLKHRVSEREIEQLANWLKAQEEERERVFISYYLPGMATDAGAWATSHFDPQLTVKILGGTDLEEIKLRARAINSDSTVLGQWLSVPNLTAQTLYRLKQSGGTFTLQTVFSSGGVNDQDVVPVQLEDERTVALVNTSDLADFQKRVADIEYYVLASSGELLMCFLGETTPFAIAKPIDNEGRDSAANVVLFNPVDFYKSRYREPRMWATQDGKFTVRARLLSRANDRLVLRKDDGTEVNVSLRQLSDADRQYVDTYR